MRYKSRLVIVIVRTSVQHFSFCIEMKFNVTFIVLLSAGMLTISYCPKNVSALSFDKFNVGYQQHNQPTNRRAVVSTLCVELSDVCILSGIELILVGSLNTAKACA